MSARHTIIEVVTGNRFRLRWEAVGEGPYVRLTVSGGPPSEPGRGRRRIEPVLDALQVAQVAEALGEWAARHDSPELKAELLANQLRAQSFDPREATLTDQALRAKADREGRPPWADHWQTS